MQEVHENMWETLRAIVQKAWYNIIFMLVNDYNYYKKFPCTSCQMFDLDFVLPHNVWLLFFKVFTSLMLILPQGSSWECGRAIETFSCWLITKKIKFPHMTCMVVKCLILILFCLTLSDCILIWFTNKCNYTTMSFKVFQGSLLSNLFLEKISLQRRKHQVWC